MMLMKEFEVPGTGKIVLLDDISSAMFKFPNKTIVIIETIEDYVNMALIQHRRILMDLEQINNSYIPRLGPHGTVGQPILVSGKELTNLLLGDIHYYIICWHKIGKLMENLNVLISLNHANLETYNSLFYNFRKIRNSFEHINERIEKEIIEIGSFDGTFFTSYDDHKIDLKNGEDHLRDFYGNLLEDLNNQMSP